MKEKIVIIFILIIIFLYFYGYHKVGRGRIVDFWNLVYLYENGERIKDSSVVAQTHRIHSQGESKWYIICKNGEVDFNNFKTITVTFYKTNEPNLDSVCKKENYQDIVECLKPYIDNSLYQTDIDIPCTEVKKTGCFNIDIKRKEIKKIDCPEGAFSKFMKEHYNVEVR